MKLFGHLTSPLPMPEEPTVWDLSDIAPWAYHHIHPEAHQAALEQGPEALAAFHARQPKPVMKSPDRLRAACDQQIADCRHALQDVEDSLPRTFQPHDPEAMFDLTQNMAVINQSIRNIGHFAYLYRMQFLAHPQAQALAAYIEERLPALGERNTEILQQIALPESHIQEMLKKKPELAAFADYMRISAQPDTPSSPSPAPKPRWQQLQELIRSAKNQSDLSTEQRGELAAQIYTLKADMALLKSGGAPFSQYAEDAGLPVSMLEQVTNQIPKAFPEKQHHVYPAVHTEWKEAVDIVITAFERFHPALGELARTAIADKWLHTANTPEKDHLPGMNISVPRSGMNPHHSHSMMTFDGGIFSVIVLGHELMHAMADSLSGDGQWLQNGEMIRIHGRESQTVGRDGVHRNNADTAHTVLRGELEPGILHETMATLAEYLIYDELANRQKTSFTRKAVQSHQAKRIQSLIADHPLKFEQALYDQVREHGPLNQMALSHLMIEHIPDALFKSVVETMGTDSKSYPAFLASNHPAAHIDQVSQPAFYSFNYALAEMGAAHIYQQHQSLQGKEKAAYADRLVNIMRQGSRENFASAMQKMDMDTDNPQHFIHPAQKRITELTGKSKKSFLDREIERRLNQVVGYFQGF